MHIMGGKQKEQMPHGLSKKRPAKKSGKKIFLLLLLLPNLFMEGVHMGKIRVEKKKETEKNRKKSDSPHK